MAIDFGITRNIANPPRQDTTPAVFDFMSAVRSGFITSNDIAKRMRESERDRSQLKTDLQTGDFQRRRLAEQEQLAPGAFDLERRKQLLAGDQTTLAERQAREQLGITSPDPSVRAETWDQKAARHFEELFTATTGGALPEELEIPAPAKVEPYSRWLEAQRSKIYADATTSFVSGELPNSPEDQQARAAFVAAAEERLLREGPNLYERYKEVAKERKVKVARGTPEYAAQAQKILDQRLAQKGIQAAKLEALPEVLKSRAMGPKASELDKVTTERLNPETGMMEEFRVVTDPRTGEVVSETKVSEKPPKLTESEANAQIYATRLSFNNRVLEDLENKGFDPAAIGSTAQAFVPNRLKTEDFQAYQSAKRNWISAALRRESGAAIAESEFKRADQEYFAKDGDSPSVVARKQKLREVVENEMRRISGPVGAASVQPGAPPVSGYEELVGKRVTLRDGRSGVVTKNSDGTFSLK